MKITDFKISIDPETFEPTMVMTLTLPLETLQDAFVQIPRDEFALIIGTELLQRIDEQNAARIKREYPQNLD